MRWLRRLFAPRRDTTREALVEAHAEAWDLASELLGLQERGIAPSTAERERVIAIATRIAGNAARAMGWMG